MVDFRYYLRCGRFVNRKMFKTACVFTALFLLVGLSGFFISYAMTSSGQARYYLQIAEHWGVLFASCFAFYAVGACSSVSANFDLDERYVNLGVWSAVVRYCAIVTVLYGVVSLASAGIVRLAYGENALIPQAMVSASALFSAMLVFLFRALAFSAVSVFLMKLNRLHPLFLILSALYAVGLFALYLILTTPLPEEGFLFDAIRFFFFERNPFLAALKSCIVIVPAFFAEFFVTERCFR